MTGTPGMSASTLQRKFASLLEKADIRVNGSRPWDIHIRDDRLYARAFARGSLGLGEAYMDEWWECEQLDEFFSRLLRARLHKQINPVGVLLYAARASLLNLQKRRRAFQVGEHHYDIGNDLYQRMLDRLMVYSCGYWKEAGTLDEAQEAKLDLACRKLQLEPGMRVVDIGCGWGGFARYAAEHYGARVTGLTVSREQAAYGREVCKDYPVDIRLQDYRDLDEPFDRAVSIGMFEHVGVKNYSTFMNVVRRCLGDEGLFLLHTIGGNRSARSADPWLARYIFPNSMLPSARQMTRAIEKRFVLEDWHNFGPDYDTTLMAWLENFRAAWPDLKQEYDDRFYRMWVYYLQSCAGAFRARTIQLWQVALSPLGVPYPYRAPR